MNAEFDALKDALDGQREHALGILEGLSEADLRRPVLPTGWYCLGLVRHLTMDIERFWFLAFSPVIPTWPNSLRPERRSTGTYRRR